MKKYHVWTKSGNLNYFCNLEELEAQKMCSYNFYYQEENSKNVMYWGKGSKEFEQYIKDNDKIVL